MRVFHHFDSQFYICFWKAETFLHKTCNFQIEIRKGSQWYFNLCENVTCFFDARHFRIRCILSKVSQWILNKLPNWCRNLTFFSSSSNYCRHALSGKIGESQRSWDFIWERRTQRFTIIYVPQWIVEIVRTAESHKWLWAVMNSHETCNNYIYKMKTSSIWHASLQWFWNPLYC